MFFIWGWSFYNRRGIKHGRTKCEHCGDLSYKRSFTQTRYISIFWLPVVPIGRRRTLNECSNCRASETLSYGKLRRLKRKLLTPSLKELERDPLEAEKAKTLLDAILKVEARDELRRVMPEIEQNFRSNPEVLLGLGKTLSALCMDDDADRVFLHATNESNRDEVGSKVFENMVVHTSARATPKPKVPRRIWQLLPVLIVPGVIIASFVAIGGMMFIPGPQHVYLVSGSDRAYEVVINGEAVELMPHQQVKTDAAVYGDNEVELVREKEGHVSFQVTVDDSPLMRLFGGPMLVINADRSAPILWEMKAYGPEETYKRTSYVGELYYSFDDVAYEFEPFPVSLGSSQSTRVSNRERVSVITGPNSMSIVQDMLSAKEFGAVRKYVLARMADGEDEKALQSMARRIQTSAQ